MKKWTSSRISPPQFTLGSPVRYCRDSIDSILRWIRLSRWGFKETAKKTKNSKNFTSSLHWWYKRTPHRSRSNNRSRHTIKLFRSGFCLSVQNLKLQSRAYRLHKHKWLEIKTSNENRQQDPPKKIENKTLKRKFYSRRRRCMWENCFKKLPENRRKNIENQRRSSIPEEWKRVRNDVESCRELVLHWRRRTEVALF
jgi:hypothetical protein